MSIPIWFLDVDGVVNALARPAPIGYQVTTAKTMGRGWRIAFSREVVDFINLVNREGFAEVRWLTTWEQDAHRELAPRVGLDTFMAYDIPEDDSTSGWWKADVVALSVAEEKRPIIWTDDELEQEDVDFLNGSLDVASCAVSTDPNIGLSDDDRVRILGFIERNNHVACRSPQNPLPA